MSWDCNEPHLNPRTGEPQGLAFEEACEDEEIQREFESRFIAVEMCQRCRVNPIYGHNWTICKPCDDELRSIEAERMV